MITYIAIHLICVILALYVCRKGLARSYGWDMIKGVAVCVIMPYVPMAIAFVLWKEVKRTGRK